LAAGSRLARGPEPRVGTSGQPGSRRHAVWVGDLAWRRGGHRTSDEGGGNTPFLGVTPVTVFLTMW